MDRDDLTPLGDILEGISQRTRTNLQPLGETQLPAIDCDVCRDARFIHPRLPSGVPDYSRIIPCDCQLGRIEEQRRDHMLETCHLPLGTEDMTFDNFIVSSGTVEARDAALELAQAGGNCLKWLTLAGPPDRGKTHLATAACHVWLGRGEPALYAYVPDLLRDLRRGFDKDDYDERFRRYCKVPLLVLDDLGAEHETPWVQQELDSIVNSRAMDGLSMIVTTNLQANELAPRIKSRLLRIGRIVTITSGEYRNQR